MEVYLLGQFQVKVAGEVITSMNHARLQELLAYLILHVEHPVSKQQLAGLFWADTEETQSRTNLRQLIFRLRQAWKGIDQYLLNTADSLQWNTAAPFWCDVLDFQQSVQVAERTHVEFERHRLLERAASLCRGDLFPGCYEDWIIPYREACQQKFSFAIEELIQISEAKGDYTSALRFAEQLRSREPLFEPVYLHLMRLHLKNGNRAGAIEIYNNCCNVFRNELDSEPGEEIRSLYKRILHLESIAEQRNEARESLPFIGRDNEWDRLNRAWLRARQGPYFLIIKGETGIGKSRLAEEFANWVRNQGFTTGSTRCYAAEDSIAYAPVVNWLLLPYKNQEYVKLEPARLREIARILPNIISEHPEIQPPPSMKESWQRLHFYEAIAQTLLGIHSQQPKQPFHSARSLPLPPGMLLIMDDLQWCDTGTMEWLHYLLHFDPTYRLLIIGTYRVEEVSPQSDLAQFIQRLRSEGMLEEIELAGLNQQSSATLASQILRHPVEEQVAAQLFLETAGNPLYVVEMARAWVMHLPGLSSRLHGIIEARLGQLQGPAAEALDIIATIGREFNWNLLSTACELSEEILAQSMGMLIEKRIIREQGAHTYNFVHDQIREVAYSRIQPSRRRILHRRVAEAIKKICVDAESASEHLLNVNAALIAGHYEKADSLYQAFQFYARAAEYAGRIYAYQEAERLYAGAIQVARRLNWPGPQLARLYAARGRALEHLGFFSEAVQVYSELEMLASERSDLEMQCVALARLAACYCEPNQVHNLVAAKPLVSKGLAIARAIGAHELEAQMHWSLLMSATHYGKPEEGREAAEACLAVAREHGLNEILATCLHDYALNLRLTGAYDYGTTCAEEARALFRAAGNLSMLVDSLNQQALMDCIQLKFCSAQEYALEAIQISRSIQNNWNLAYAIWIQGMISEAQGKYEDAMAFWEESIAIGQEAGFLMSFTTVKLAYGDLLRRFGRLDQAMQFHQEALEASKNQAPFMLFAAKAQMASDLFMMGELTDGERYLKEAQESEAIGVIGPCFGLPFVSQAWREWADQTGEWQVAIVSIQRVLEEVQRRKLPFDEMQVLFDYGRCLEGAGQVDQAREVFLSILPDVKKSLFHRLCSQLDVALAAHPGDLDNLI